MHSVFVPLPRSLLDELGRRARNAHRRPQDHAAYILEQALAIEPEGAVGEQPDTATQAASRFSTAHEGGIRDASHA